MAEDHAPTPAQEPTIEEANAGAWRSDAAGLERTASIKTARE
jgi:hypothetical protein